MDLGDFRRLSDSPGRVLNTSDGKTAAVMTNSYAEDGTNPHLLDVDIDVGQAHRRNGIG